MQTDTEKVRNFDSHAAFSRGAGERQSRCARFSYVAVLLASLFATQTMGAAANSPPELVGKWQGTTEISGPFKIGTYPSTVPADHQTVVVEIATSGAVTGRIGQAVFVQGVVEPNRGWMGRTLHVATDYIVRGVMEGKVTPTDPGGRREFTLPFNIVDGKLLGGIKVSPNKPLTRPLRLEKANLDDATKR